MGSVAAAVQDDSTSPSELEAAFLERCAASGDAAYGELRELLSRLHDPATRQEARIFLTGLRRRSCSDPGGEEGFFRRYGFCVRELLLHDSRCGLPITTLSSGDALHTNGSISRLGQRLIQTGSAHHIFVAHGHELSSTVASHMGKSGIICTTT
uniref:Uncharacterized protein n=1 Tax=Triticum urartu TaxID=4572 RepID=A0A8R7NXD0_TRIUA